MTDIQTKKNTMSETAPTYSAKEATLVSCIIGPEAGEKVADHLTELGLNAFIESGRVIREFIKPKMLSVTNAIKLRSDQSLLISCVVPSGLDDALMQSIISLTGLKTPGSGSVFAQQITEYSTKPLLDKQELKKLLPDDLPKVHLIKDLAYVVCVLTGHELGEKLAKTALDLGVCVPLLTYGSGNDVRDQLGLIRITISPDKEIVHLIMPRHDSENVIRLLIEENRLDRTGRGHIYVNRVSSGLLDTRLKIGKQSHAASIDQIIAAIDTLKMGTDWRKRLDAGRQKASRMASLQNDSCKISIISNDDALDDLRKAWVQAGAIGAVTSRVTLISTDPNQGQADLMRSELSVSMDTKDKVLDRLVEVCESNELDCQIHVTNP